MLRITAQNETSNVTLKLEGDLTGVWVRELYDAWRTAIGDLGGRALCVDLTAVGRVDHAGEYLLALLRCTSATELVGSGIISAGLISSIEHDWLDCENATKEA